MNTKNNQRSRLTVMLIKQAYLDLMRTTQAARITVKEICQNAEINRSTFYLHFSEPNDVLRELEDETIAQIIRYMNDIGTSYGDSSNARESLLFFLNYIRRNDELFRGLLAENSDPHFRRKLQEAAMGMTTQSFDFSVPEECRSSTFVFIVSGSIELLIKWIRSGYDLTEQQMCDMLFLLCEGSLRSICAQ